MEILLKHHFTAFRSKKGEETENERPNAGEERSFRITIRKRGNGVKRMKHEKERKMTRKARGKGTV